MYVCIYGYMYVVYGIWMYVYVCIYIYKLFYIHKSNIITKRAVAYSLAYKEALMQRTIIILSENSWD